MIEVGADAAPVAVDVGEGPRVDRSVLVSKTIMAAAVHACCGPAVRPTVGAEVSSG